MKSRVLLILGIAALAAGLVPAFGQIANGDFDNGNLAGWTAGGINGGSATVFRQGACASFFDTAGIQVKGGSAAKIRSSASAPTDSMGVLTSDPFIASAGISFRALTENSDNQANPNPVTLEVWLLAGEEALSQTVSTNVVTLGGKCGVSPDARNGVFSAHFLDTSAFAGQTVRVEFRQRTNVPQFGFFTLIDDVAVVPVSVAIDIGGTRFRNTLRPAPGGTLPVAILSTAAFDARTVDPATVVLTGPRGEQRGKGTTMASFEDVNGDTYPDLLIYVRRDAEDPTDSAGVTALEAKTWSGVLVSGKHALRLPAPVAEPLARVQ